MKLLNIVNLNYIINSPLYLQAPHLLIQPITNENIWGGAGLCHKVTVYNAYIPHTSLNSTCPAFDSFLSKQWKMAQVLESLLPMVETKIEFLAPGFDLGQYWLLWSF